MDQEVYDAVMGLLAAHPDQNGVSEFAMLLSFHYPEFGRAVLGLPVLTEPLEHATMTVEEETTHG